MRIKARPIDKNFKLLEMIIFNEIYMNIGKIRERENKNTWEFDLRILVLVWLIGFRFQFFILFAYLHWKKYEKFDS